MPNVDPPLHSLHAMLFLEKQIHSPTGLGPIQLAKAQELNVVNRMNEK